MARMDHYENGKWVGSTEVDGHSNVTGWVNTYSSDGKSRSTWVSNTDTFDYKEKPRVTISGEDLINKRANEKAANELIWNVFGKVYKFIFILGIPILIVMGLFVVVTLVENIGLQEIIISIKALTKDFLKSEEFIALVLGVLGSVWPLLLLIPGRKKKNGKRKK